MTTTHIATLEELEAEGFRAQQNPAPNKTEPNKMLWDTVGAVENPDKEDPRLTEIFRAFNKGYFRGIREDSKNMFSELQEKGIFSKEEVELMRKKQKEQNLFGN